MQSFLLNTALISIAAALLKLAVPMEKIPKQLSFLITCFFIICVVNFAVGSETSVRSIISDISVENDYIDFSVEEANAVKRAAAENLSGEIKEILAQSNIFPENVYIIINISDNNSISISEIKLVLKQADIKESEKCVQIIKEYVGEGIEISIEFSEV